MGKNQKRFLTKRGRISVAITLITMLVILGMWYIHAINIAAANLRENPAFRVVDSCKTRVKNPYFCDHIITEDFKIIPCE